MKSQCGCPLYWHNCYSGTYDLISPESVSHPAKMSPALCFRILQHLQELGLLKQEDIVFDPMAGTGMTNICAGAMGYKSISVELEEKFVNFQRQSKEYAERRLYKPLDWQMIQGDSRNLSELMGRGGLKSVMSPPYEGQSSTHDRDRQQDIERMHRKGMKVNPDSADAKVIEFDYGSTEGQIGGLKDIPLKAITSPPYGDAEKRDRSKEASNKKEKDYPRGDHNISAGYQGSDSNIGKLDDKPLKSVMSPPYEGGGHHKGMLDSWGGKNTPVSHKSKDNHGYGNTEGQVEKAESYLEAMRKVYSEIVKVSDVLTVVVKNPTRNGKLRRLDLDTIKILEMSGWRIHCQHRALLFEELEQADMFEGSKKRVKGRMSFFKRLSWQDGQPVAFFEDVIICVRNEGIVAK